jgi:Na+/H+ antiporter NhaD/arsenite permease-like protein
MSDLLAPVFALTIAVATLTLILIRPRRLPEPAVALGGATLMVLLGLISPRDALLAVASSWNVLLFFVELMVASFILPVASPANLPVMEGAPTPGSACW